MAGISEAEIEDFVRDEGDVTLESAKVVHDEEEGDMTDDAGISMRPNQGAGRAGRCGGGGEREHDVGGAALEEGACAGRCRSSPTSRR